MNSPSKGVLFVFSGPSGVGKDTVLELFLRENLTTVKSISATTRPMREGEVDGRDYFFLTEERFEQMIAAGQMLEYARYGGSYYGTPRAFVEEELKAGRNVILKIEVQGAFQVRRLMPEAVLIFVMPPSFAELRRRLTGRGTDSQESIRRRLKTAVEEIACAKDYDYIIVNDDLEDACRQLSAVTEAAAHQAKFYENFMKEVHEECLDLQ